MAESTSIYFYKIKEGSDFAPAGSVEADAFKKAIAILIKQPGYIRSFWGPRVQSPNKVVGTIDWRDVADNKKFMESDAYKSVILLFEKVFDMQGKPPFVYTVNFKWDSVTARKTHITEFASFDIAASSSSEEKAKLESQLESSLDFVRENNGRAPSIGWSIDRVQVPQGLTHPLQLFLGWDSLDDCAKIGKHPDFHGVLSPLRAMVLDPTEDMEMFYARLRADSDFLN